MRNNSVEAVLVSAYFYVCMFVMIIVTNSSLSHVATTVHMTADELLTKVFPDTDIKKQRYGIPVGRYVPSLQLSPFY